MSKGIRGGKDWCSLFPDRFLFWDWSKCCKKHDHDYEHLPSYDREFFRELRDEDLRRCVNKILPRLGDIMYAGIRLFNPIYRLF